MIIVSEIKPDKLNLFFQFFRTVRKARFFNKFDNKDCQIMATIHDFIKSTDSHCIKECGVSLRQEIESEVIEVIRQRIKKEFPKSKTIKIYG